jgi:2,3-bisphosphoglycerate-dependent phosphoglycerate mutase
MSHLALNDTPGTARGIETPPLVLLRHGQSEWNRDKRFTGWTDICLSPGGAAEAQRAGESLQRAGYAFDLCFTSVLQRATQTSEILLAAMGLSHVPIERSWRLNERHYGALQGLDLWRAVRRHGLLPVLRCQYQFASRPPVLAPADARFPGHDPRYQSLRADEIPCGESHADTLARLAPYWHDRIAPEIARGRRVLIVSHKNTLRALVKMIEQHSDAEMRRLRIPTGVPIVLTHDRDAAPGWRRLQDR